MGDGRAEGLSAMGDGGQAAISLMPEAEVFHSHTFAPLKVRNLKVHM